MPSLCYISSSCNRTPNSADWGRSGLIVYGASYAVAVYNTKRPSSVKCTLVGHSGNVNCVRWVDTDTNEPETEFVSTSADHTAIVWRRVQPLTAECHFEVQSRLAGHTDSVTLAAASYVRSPDNETSTSHQYGCRLIVVTSSVDSTVKVWERNATGEKAICTCIQTISLNGGLVLSLALTVLPGVLVPLLALGRDNLSISLHVEQNHQFVEVQRLRGHEEWILGLSFAIDDSCDVRLASCSQDTYVRLWRIRSASLNSTGEPVTVSETGTANNEQNIPLKLKEDHFVISSSDNQRLQRCYTVTLDSVLQSHDNWVYSVRWHPIVYSDYSERHQPLCILSASMDKTLILWEPNADSDIWTESVRVGEVGGGNLGFYGCAFGPGGQSVMAHGYQGAFHIWCRVKQDILTNNWLPGVTSGGHFGPVCDIAWDPNGRFLVSVSADQTTRLHGYWISNDSSESSWHEISRPQIHGYDMQCIAMLDRFSFVSGADEKILRVFRAPNNFLENFSKLCCVDVTDGLNRLKDGGIAEGATVPALGLSNKAVYVDQHNVVDAVTENQASKELVRQGGGESKVVGSDQYQAESYFVAQTLCAPPTEENLLQNTLWPEVQKLYGHGYEVFALACHPHGTIVASACKASKSEHAAIILWDASTWRQLCKLDSHSLTITQLAFSHNGDRLLSVSRDRTWTVFQCQTTDKTCCIGDNNGIVAYNRIAYTDKKTAIHSRIIWSCSWSHDDKFFITVSRDKKALVWSDYDLTASDSEGCKTQSRAKDSCIGDYSCCSGHLDLAESITAVDFAPLFINDNRYLLAFGLETGIILLYNWQFSQNPSCNSWQALYQFDQCAAHHLTVRRLQFQPQPARFHDPSSNHIEDRTLCHSDLHLASCGDDNTVKIYHIDLEEFTVHS